MSLLQALIYIFFFNCLLSVGIADSHLKWNWRSFRHKYTYNCRYEHGEYNLYVCGCVVVFVCRLIIDWVLCAFENKYWIFIENKELLSMCVNWLQKSINDYNDERLTDKIDMLYARFIYWYRFIF